MKNRLLVIIILLLTVSFHSMKAEKLVSIEFSAPAKDGIVDFGVIRKGQPLSTSVTVTNITDGSLYFDNQTPYYILQDPLFPAYFQCEDCNTFFQNEFSLDSLLPSESYTFQITHKFEDLRTAVAKQNFFFANLHITPSKSPVLDLLEFNENTNAFLLIGRIDTSALSTFVKFASDRDSLKLDTLNMGLHIGDGVGSASTWSLANLSTIPITVDSLWIEPISDNVCDNFGLSYDYKFPLSLMPSKDELDININYSANRNCPSDDTVAVICKFVEEGVAGFDTLISVASSMPNTWEITEYSVNNSNLSSTPSLNIDVGDLSIGTNHNIKVNVLYSGGFDQELRSFRFETSDGETIESYNLLSLPTKTFKFQSNAQLDFTINSANPREMTDYLILKTSLSSQGFSNTNSVNTDLRIGLRGRFIGPTLSVVSDSIDFGQVVGSEICESSNDTIIEIVNTGTDSLRIALIPDPSDIFYSEVLDTILPSNSVLKYQVSFTPKQVGPYTGQLRITSNDLNNSERTIYLTGTSISSPLIKLFSDNTTSKPGTKVRMPIKIGVGNVSVANSFSCFLEYNNTILNFNNYEIVGSASSDVATSSRVGPAFDTLGTTYLPINLVHNKGESFSSDSILIYLDFDTFLGNSESSSIRFINPLFGNSNCPDIARVENINFNYRLDSVLGLQNKVFEKNPDVERISIESISVRNGTIVIGGLTRARASLEVSFYDLYGRLYQSEVSELTSGPISMELELQRLRTGIVAIHSKGHLLFTQKVYNP